MSLMLGKWSVVPRVIRELSSLGALGGVVSGLGARGEGASQQGLEQKEDTPHTWLRVTGTRYRGGNWSRPPGAECLGEHKVRQKDWNGQPGG